MKCKYQKYINQWVEQRIVHSQKPLFEAHLKGCGSCQKEVIAYQKLNELLRSSIPVTKPSSDFERIFWQKLLERQKEPWWAKVSRQLESLVPMLNLSQAFALLFFALIIGGAGGTLSAMNTLTSNNMASSRTSIQYLSGFQEFQGVPSASVTAAYLRISEKREISE